MIFDIHSNHSGFFDTETYSQLVMHESVEPFAQELSFGQWALGLHDAAPTHNGFVKAKRDQEEQHFHFAGESLRGACRLGLQNTDRTIKGCSMSSSDGNMM